VLIVPARAIALAQDMGLHRACAEIFESMVLDERFGERRAAGEEAIRLWPVTPDCSH
jgi:hypothetical protein